MQGERLFARELAWDRDSRPQLWGHALSSAWQIRVYEQQKLVHTADLTGPTELGRQTAAEETLYSHHLVSGRQRLVIAPKDEKSISRQHVLIEPQAEGGFRVTNLSAERSIGLADGHDLRPKAECSMSGDVLLTLGKRSIRLQETRAQEPPLQGLDEPTVPPGQSSIMPLPLASPASIDLKALLHWLQATTDVLQSAANSVDFFDKAARAVVDLVNLDSGRVLLRPSGTESVLRVMVEARDAAVADRCAKGIAEVVAKAAA